MFGSILSAIAAIGRAVTGFFDMQERKAHEDRGALKEQLRQSEDARKASREAREIEDQVEDMTDSEIIELSKRFVRRGE